MTASVRGRAAERKLKAFGMAQGRLKPRLETIDWLEDSAERRVVVRVSGLRTHVAGGQAGSVTIGLTMSSGLVCAVNQGENKR